MQPERERFTGDANGLYFKLVFGIIICDNPNERIVGRAPPATGGASILCIRVQMDRVIAYVDGYNLYFGIRSKGWRDLYWLNIQRLIEQILKPNQQLMRVKYFTARVSDPIDKKQRQATYLEALGTLPDFDIVYGKYQSQPTRCHFCGTRSRRHSEKMTDVNIAVELLGDSYRDAFDTAILISGDSDLTPPIRALRQFFPNKRVVSIFPPNRHSKELKQTAHAFYAISRTAFENAVFPDVVLRQDGFPLKRPASWSATGYTAPVMAATKPFLNFWGRTGAELGQLLEQLVATGRVIGAAYIDQQGVLQIEVDGVDRTIAEVRCLRHSP